MKNIQQIPTQILPTQPIQQKIQKQQLIGKGSFGSVWCITQNGKKYAIKKIDKLLINRQGRQKQLRRQIQALRLIQNQNIVKFYNFDESHSKYYTIKMQFCAGKNLKKFLIQQQQIINTKFPNNKYFATKVCLDFINALAQVRSKMLANRDIKPENIMIQVTQDFKVISKMIDFGEAQFNIRQGMTMVGTNGYMAPEIYFHIGQYDSEISDMWSFGVTLYEIFQGLRVQENGDRYIGTPFQPGFSPKTAKDFQNYYKKYIYQGVILDIDKVPGPFRQIIRKCLRPNPKDRINFYQTLQILQKRFSQLHSIFYNNLEAQNQQRKLYEALVKEKYNTFRKNKIQKHAQIIKILSELFIKIQQKIPKDQFLKYSFVCNMIVHISEQQEKYMNEIQNILQIDENTLIEDILINQLTFDGQQFRKITINKIRNIIGNKIQDQFYGITKQFYQFVQKNFGEQAQIIIANIQFAFEMQ